MAEERTGSGRHRRLPLRRFNLGAGVAGRARGGAGGAGGQAGGGRRRQVAGAAAGRK